MLDNVKYHHNRDTLKLLKEAGFSVLFTPVCSSNLNPIEKIWALAKRKLQRQLCQMDHDQLRVLRKDEWRQLVQQTMANLHVDVDASLIARSHYRFMNWVTDGVLV